MKKDKRNKNQDSLNSFDDSGIIIEDASASSYIIPPDGDLSSEGREKKEKDKKKKKDKTKGLSKAQLAERYCPKCTQVRFWEIVILSIIGSIGVSIGYQLQLPYTIVVIIATFFMSQTAILKFCENLYENKKIEDTASYIEQMLYSFRRNSKILTSLQDTITIFEDGEMKDHIQRAIDHIIASETVGNVYEEALMIIQENYDCRRIRSLHRYFVKVEGVGGDHEMGIEALIADRRMWLERVDDFKKEKGNTVKEIIISCLFSSIICAVTMRMLPQYVGASQHIIAQIGSLLYILVNLFTVSATIKRTVFYLNDTYTQEEEEYLLKKLRWYKTWDKKTEMKRAFKPAMMMFLVGIVSPFVAPKFWWMSLICGALAAFMYFVQPITKHNSTRKNITKEIEKTFPDWLLELSLLLQTDNLHVAMEKTIETAPLLLSDDLRTLADEVAMYPTEVEPYIKFLHDFALTNVHSSMKLLYSISAYGSTDEEKQIRELIQRNASLMNKAEQQKNIDRLSKVYVFKFIPMGASALKLICDMGVFLIVFITQSLSAL